MQDQPQGFGQVRRLRLRHRRRAPVFGPAVVQDAHQGVHLVSESGHVHRPQHQAGGRRPGEPGLHAGREHRDARIVGVEVLDLAVAQRFDARGRVGRIVRHHEHRRGVEAVDQQADLFVDRQVERTHRRLAAALAQPRFGDVEQGGEHGRVVLGGDHAEVAGRRLRIGARQVIDLRADPADVDAVPHRQPELMVGVLEERVLLGRQRLAALEQQRGDIVRIARVEPHRQADEALEPGAPRHGNDLERAAHPSA